MARLTRLTRLNWLTRLARLTRLTRLARLIWGWFENSRYFGSRAFRGSEFRGSSLKSPYGYRGVNPCRAVGIGRKLFSRVLRFRVRGV